MVFLTLRNTIYPIYEPLSHNRKTKTFDLFLAEFLYFPLFREKLHNKKNNNSNTTSSSAMARAPHVVVLALVMFAIIGMAHAADAPNNSPNEDDYEEDDTEFLIGTRSGDAPSPSNVVAAPIGGPVPPGAFDDSNPPSAASSSLHHISAVAGVATAALAASFYF